MAPPCAVFEASQLPSAIQTVDGKKRKPASEAASTRIDLSACELLAMTQFECRVERPEISGSPVRCWPVQRWFRRCQEKKGSFMVETTMWEGTAAAEAEAAANKQGGRQAAAHT